MDADKAIAKAFAEVLTGGGDNPLRFRMIDDKKTRALPAKEFTDTIDQAWPMITGLQAEGYACFYFLNEVGADAGQYARDADVTRVRAIPADFDQGLPRTWHTLPDLLVHTSPNKGQALWLGNLPTPENFKSACRRIIARYGSDPAVCNLSRILRLPGSLHLKGEPHLVTYERLG